MNGPAAHELLIGSTAGDGVGDKLAAPTKFSPRRPWATAWVRCWPGSKLT